MQVRIFLLQMLNTQAFLFRTLAQQVLYEDVYAALLLKRFKNDIPLQSVKKK
jgi:hypothetical protein